MIRLYQPFLSDEQIGEVNSGLNGHDVYMRLGLLREANAVQRVWDAFGYYRHTANVATDDPNVVFEVTNIGPENLIERLRTMRSGSVGDVLILNGWGLDRKGWICAPYGWVEMTPVQVRYFESRVTTIMKIGEPV